MSQTSEADLLARRAAIRRGLLRANTAAVAVVVVVIALAVVAIFQANRAETSALMARVHSEKLLKSLPAQLMGSRGSGNIDWRREVLASLAAAARIDPSAALRDEAIAHLAEVDLHQVGVWGTSQANRHAGFDSFLDHYFKKCAAMTKNPRKITPAKKYAIMRGLLLQSAQKQRPAPRSTSMSRGSC